MTILPTQRRNNPSLADGLNYGWAKMSFTATYASGTTFTVTGDKTAVFTLGRKLRIYHQSSGTYKYVTVISSSYGAPTTTVTVTGETLLSETYSSIWVDLSPASFADATPILRYPSGTFAAGDILYASSATQLARLAKPSDTALLFNDDDGVPQWILDGWLPAGEMWTYASADDPTFTFTISGDKTAKYSVGMRIKLTQTTAKYFIVTAVAYGAPNTTVTVYGGTDYDLANAAITSPFYSRDKAPVGFPLDPTKWTHSLTDTSDRTQATPTAGTWYNLGTLSVAIPIGAWHVRWEAATYSIRNATTEQTMYAALSTQNNAASDADLIAWDSLAASTNDNKATGAVQGRSKTIVLTSKTTYYLIAKATVNADNIHFFANSTGITTAVRAICAYL